ncbi:MAG: reverse transcriptase domain-containing protein, partial [Pseudomonadota bacterium]
MTSFDAVQLFTNIPVKDTIEHITNTIPISDIPIDKQTLKTLLEIACTQVPFRFNKKHYIQTEGLSMGSSLAPLMAEFSMHMIERNITAPKLYMRYVDDCLAAFENEESAILFLDNLNSHHPSIQFTMEKPIHGKINFLDMTVSAENGHLSTDWHIKSTNTYLYTHSQAYSPSNYKDNAIRASVEGSY